MLDDLRYALRTLLRSPRFTAVAVVVLALGIGANAAVFSVVNAVLLRPLPYPHPEQLCIIHEAYPLFADSAICYPDYADWCARQRSFADLAIYRRQAFNASFAESSHVPPEKVQGAIVSTNYLSVLGLRPTQGRDFTESEHTPGGPAAVLLSDGFWRRRFHADPTVIGQQLTLDNIPHEIIGVMPPQVTFPRKAEVIVTLRDLSGLDILTNRGNRDAWSACGRLRPGITMAQGRADLDGIAADLARCYPDTNTGVTINLSPLLDYHVKDYRKDLWLLFGAVGGVLLVACANVANLQLAHVVVRTREFAIRAALGASRWRLLRQTLAESIVLGVLGGVPGIWLAAWLTDTIVAVEAALPRFEGVYFDSSGLLFAVVISIATGTLAGLWPAWRMSHPEIMAVILRENNARGISSGVRPGRVRTTLVVVQIALTVVLLNSAISALRGLYTASTQSLGFRSAGLLLTSLWLPAKQYPPEKARQFYRALLERVRALDGVQQAAVVSNPPCEDLSWRSSIHVAGTPHEPLEKMAIGNICLTTPGYFQSMGIPVLRGRDFAPQDAARQPPVAIIDEKLARQCFADRDPIGQRLDDLTLDTEEDTPPLTIIGVVPFVRHEAPGQRIEPKSLPQCYLNLEQFPQPKTRLMVRARDGDPLRLEDELQRTVSSLDPTLPLFDTTTMERRVAHHLTPQRLTTMLLGVFAAVALSLAVMGLYGMTALSVTRRTHELSIRIALGAQRTDVLMLVLRRGVLMIGVGLILGLMASYGLSWILWHYGLHSGDLPAFGTVCAVVAGVELLACWVPARRVTRLDPMAALRDQ